MLLLLVLSGWFAAWADSAWTVYVNSQKFSSITGSSTDAMQVDLVAFARATGLAYDKSGATFNGKPVTGLTTQDGVDYLPLKTVVDLAGMQMDVRSDLQMIEIRPKPVVRSEQDIEKEMVHAYAVQTYPQMDYLYKMVVDAYNNRLHLTITRPIVTHWCTLDEIHKLAGPDGYGYSTAHVVGTTVTELHLYVPFGLSASKTLHSLAHERAHCWQYDHGILEGPPMKMEGFAEWVASKVLENLTLAGEMQDLKENQYAQYREGFEYFEKLERTQGVHAVLADMLKTK
jgi:hypothetical protein